MGKMISDVLFNGTVGSFVAYRLPGVEGVVIRSKGEVSRKRRQKAPEFERTRQLNAEFSGRSAASQYLMRAMRPMKALGDYNIAGPLNALLRTVQLLDTTSARGQRHVQLSLDPSLIEGFPFNKHFPLQSVIRENIITSINREAGTASIQIPELVPALNFSVPKLYPKFKLVAVLGVMPDIFYAGSKQPRLYQPRVGYRNGYYAKHETPWTDTHDGMEATTLTLALDTLPPDAAHTLVLTLGIAYGTVLHGRHIEQVKRAGSACIVRMA